MHWTHLNPYLLAICETSFISQVSNSALLTFTPCKYRPAFSRGYSKMCSSNESSQYSATAVTLWVYSILAKSLRLMFIAASCLKSCFSPASAWFLSTSALGPVECFEQTTKVPSSKPDIKMIQPLAFIVTS
ncbi:hypothetical protein AWRI1631_101150 [Saccharomyces cerevisiae AWRI1631]|uniref:J0928 protein n=2 Tax=Saccharomyces cerevisiae TaxID=4932 RepID=E9PA70_YEASX|nr:hypothetical protein AWRI1631_101150 [Saccharomyces cerevisiae AWRI1631]CAA58483.1 J0928 [Saccharomyces cerevisiae]